MSDTNEELEVQIEDAAPKEAEVVVDEAPRVEAQPGPTQEDAVANLRAQLDAEKAARLAAEQRAQAEASQRHMAQSEVEDANLQLVNTAIETVKGANTNLKAQLSAAYRAQDFDAVAELQEAIAVNASRLTQLENGKQAMEAAPKREAPKPMIDPVEALAGQLSPRSAAWVRAHPEYASDPNKLQKMIAAHNLATADGIPPDTDDYFEAIESTLKIRRPEPEPDADPMAGAAKVTQRRVAPAAAPVSRSGGTPGARPNTVRLTREEIEAAEISGLTPEQYARNKYALAKEGKLH